MVFSVHERIDVSAKLQVVLGERVGVIVLDLKFAVVVVPRQVEALAKFTHATNKHFLARPRKSGWRLRVSPSISARTSLTFVPRTVVSENTPLIPWLTKSSVSPNASKVSDCP